jgi:hypothetical protein
MPFRASARHCRLRFARPGQQGDGVDRALDLLATGASVVVLELTGSTAIGTQVDQEVAMLMADVVERMLARGMAPAGGAPFTTQDIGIVDPHVASGEAVRRELELCQLPGGSPLVGTPEVWQGLERPLIITHHPLSGVGSVSAFSLDPGRLCVAISRHLYGCVIVARAGMEVALLEHPYDSGARPLGSDDRLRRGMQLHLQFLRDLRQLGRIIPA